MNTNEYKTFADAWANAHEVMPAGKVLSQGAMKMCIESLRHYPLDMLLLAINKHVQTAKYAPAPKDIIDLLEIANKRLTADEAWAMRPKDEFETVVWTDEMAEAYNIAYDLIVDGDLIAARMAFKGAYERLCNEAMLTNRSVVWKVCKGYDKKRIEPALQQAVLAGRITQERANKYLPSPMDAGPIAGLISGKVTELPANNENLKARWGELSQALLDGQKKMAEKDRQRVADNEQKRLEFENKKQAMLDRVASLQGASA